MLVPAHHDAQVTQAVPLLLVLLSVLQLAFLACLAFY
jgi:hypothetical protein